MSRLNELIEKLCPNGVEYKKIWEVCDKVFAGGTPKTSQNEYYDNGTIPWLRSGEINFKEISKTEINITEKGLKESSAKMIKPFSVLIAMTGATVGRSAVNLISLSANQSVCALEVGQNINYKFLYYYIESKYNVLKYRGQGALTSLNLSIIKEFSIPVPPLEIQEEIVRILDNFTELIKELTSNLTKELEARKIQYEYYRDKLLKNKNYSTKVVKLKDVCKYSKDRINSSDLDEKTYVGVDNLLQDKQGKKLSSYVPETGTSIKYSKGDVLLGNIRPYLRKIWLADNQGGTNGDVLVLKPNQKKIIPEYLYHTLASESFFEYNNRFSKGAKMPRGDKAMIMKYDIPLPTMDIQKRIADVLGNFESISSDLNIGLPAEIEARQKQYEYYRDKLLSFK